MPLLPYFTTERYVVPLEGYIVEGYHIHWDCFAIGTLSVQFS